MIKRYFTICILVALLFTYALAAIFTRQPTANESPDTSGQGGIAVETPTNTGHAATLASGVNSSTTNRTCRWTGFQGVTGVIRGITLSVGWSEDGSFAGGSSSFRVQYSTDNGTNWTNLFDHTSVNAANSGTAQASLPANANITQIQVRSRVTATGPLSGTTTITGAVSNITLTVTTQKPHVIVMM